MNELRFQAISMALTHFPGGPVDKVMQLAGDIVAFVTEDLSAPKPRRKTATAQPTADVSDDAAASLTAEAEDLHLEDEELEPARPMPETAKQIVDAGTGKPAGKADAPITMTFDDVKVAAAKLAAKDTPALAKILKKYDAANLSGVDKAQLGDFASDVMEALG